VKQIVRCSPERTIILICTDLESTGTFVPRHFSNTNLPLTQTDIIVSPHQETVSHATALLCIGTVIAAVHARNARQSSTQEQSLTEAERAKLLATGKELFVERCAKCHNERGALHREPDEAQRFRTPPAKTIESLRRARY
jgi:hypothetical protein